jgi:hypothetical protein
MDLIDRLAAVRKAPFGCLADGCDVTDPTCPGITEHMQSEHPELGVTDHPQCATPKS